MKTAEPATSTSAPMAAQLPAVSGVTPPSISIWISRSPIISASRAILGNWASMKLWPPKPGFTVITQTRSIRSRTHSIASGGVAGFSATPALAPSERMYCSERSRCGPASAWMVMMSAPALAKASR